MNKTMLAATLCVALTAGAGPAQPAAPATPATPATPAIPAACVERMKAHAEKMKQELGLSEAQAAALRTEMERHHGVMLTARADHKAAVAKILTPEQNAKLEGKRGAMRQKMMERCAMDDDDEAMGGHGKRKH